MTNLVDDTEVELTREEKRAKRVVASATRMITLLHGSYAKPSEVRALLRDPKFEVTKRGAVKIRGSDDEE